MLAGMVCTAGLPRIRPHDREGGNVNRSAARWRWSSVRPAAAIDGDQSASIGNRAATQVLLAAAA